MALSKDKRRRNKLERAGKLNPEVKRNDWGSIKPVEKMTPTLAEKMKKQQNKHRNKWNSYANDKDSILFLHSEIISFRRKLFISRMARKTPTYDEPATPKGRR